MVKGRTCRLSAIGRAGIDMGQRADHYHAYAGREAPHFSSYTEEVDVTDLEALRATLNARWGKTRGKLTLLPFLAKAMINALPDYPQINARFHDDDGFEHRFEGVHLGIALRPPRASSCPSSSAPKR